MFALLLACCAAPPPLPKPISSLKESVTFTESQETAGGISSTIYSIGVNGNWIKAYRYISHSGDANLGRSRILETGTLTKAKLEKLSALLKVHKFDKLPKSSGRKEPVNPHIYSLKCGDYETTLHGIAPFRGDKKKANSLKEHIKRWYLPDNDVGERFANIAQGIVDLCKKDE